MVQRAETMKLTNRTKGVEVAANVRVARTFWQRTRGLLGETGLAPGAALWIQGTAIVPCNSIHTFFMRFAIDVVFVDRQLRVKKVFRDLGPWRMTMPAEGAFSVFELPAGALKSASVEVGDQLHVGD